MSNRRHHRHFHFQLLLQDSERCCLATVQLFEVFLTFFLAQRENCFECISFMQAISKGYFLSFLLNSLSSPTVVWLFFSSDLTSFFPSDRLELIGCIYYFYYSLLLAISRSKQFKLKAFFTSSLLWII